MYVYKYERLVKLSKSQGIPQGHSAQGLTKSQSANFDSGQPQLSYMILTKYSSVYTGAHILKGRQYWLCQSARFDLVKTCAWHQHSLFLRKEVHWTLWELLERNLWLKVKDCASPSLSPWDKRRNSPLGLFLQVKTVEVMSGAQPLTKSKVATPYCVQDAKLWSEECFQVKTQWTTV